MLATCSFSQRFRVFGFFFFSELCEIMSSSSARQCRIGEERKKHISHSNWICHYNCVCVFVCLCFFLFIFLLVHYTLKMFWAAVLSHFEPFFHSKRGTLIAIFFECWLDPWNWSIVSSQFILVFVPCHEGIWHAKCGSQHKYTKIIFHFLFLFPFEFDSYFFCYFVCSVEFSGFCFDCRFTAIVNFHFK